MIAKASQRRVVVGACQVAPKNDLSASKKEPACRPMSTAKQTKDLLDQVRRLLDEESRAAVEPVLRNILEVAKPKTVTQVEYRHDPADEAKFDAMRAALDSKDEEILKLRIKLRTAQADNESWRESFSRNERRRAADKAQIDRLRSALVSKDEEIRELRRKHSAAEAAERAWESSSSLKEVLKTANKKSRAFRECIIKAMYLVEPQPEPRQKKDILATLLILGNLVLVEYLTVLESCAGVDAEELHRIVDEESVETLARVAQRIRATAGIDVDLKIRVHRTPSGFPKPAHG